jgi:membrane associated rhomboid family serine protease
MNSSLFPQFSFTTSATKLVVAAITVTVLFQLLGVTAMSYLSFSPVLALWGLEIWRPFTALLCARNPLELVFGGLIIYSLGHPLERWYGPRKFFGITLGIPLASFFLVACSALVLPNLLRAYAYTGFGAVISTIWIVFGLRSALSGQQLNFWGIPISGQNFAALGVGFIVLQMLFVPGVLPLLPDMLAATLSYLYMMRGAPSLQPFRFFESAYYNWKLKRLKAKRGIHIVNGNRPKGKDDYTIH